MRTVLAITALLAFATPAQANFGGVPAIADIKAVEAKPKQQPKAKKKRLPQRHDLWVRIGRCEQPGRGYKGVYWSHPGPRYQGGLGFYSGTWQAFKVKGMPANAGQATWRQQMWVANRIFNRYGGSHPWGCG